MARHLVQIGLEDVYFQPQPFVEQPHVVLRRPFMADDARDAHARYDIGDDRIPLRLDAPENPIHWLVHRSPSHHHARILSIAPP